jgi:hypothetical protein
LRAEIDQDVPWVWSLRELAENAAQVDDGSHSGCRNPAASATNVGSSKVTAIRSPRSILD